jgi:hypothetical protein
MAKKIISSCSCQKTAKKKKTDWEAEGYTEPSNAFAICNSSLGGKGEEGSEKRKKWERCTKHVKDQNKDEKKSYFDIYSIIKEAEEKRKDNLKVAGVSSFIWNIDIGNEPDVEITVYYEPTPGEKQTWDYPGSQPTIEIYKVIKNDNGMDITDECLNDPQKAMKLQNAAINDIDQKTPTRDDLIDEDLMTERSQEKTRNRYYNVKDIIKVAGSQGFDDILLRYMPAENAQKMRFFFDSKGEEFTEKYMINQLGLSYSDARTCIRALKSSM